MEHVDSLGMHRRLTATTGRAATRTVPRTPGTTSITANAGERSCNSEHADDRRHRDVCASIRVGQIVDAIKNRLFDPSLNVKTLKAYCGIRDNNVSQRFKNERGVYISEYILGRRLDAGERMLCHTDLSIAEIAYRTGYTHLQTFYRLFKFRYGCTPARYRAASRQQLGDRGSVARVSVCVND